MALGSGIIYPGSFGKLLQCFGKCQPFNLHYEGKNIARLAAAETFEDTFIFEDIEGRGFLRMKRAQPDMISAPFSKPDMLRDDIHDARGMTYPFDYIIGSAQSEVEIGNVKSDG